jgi:Tol biopolymer transport system component
MAKSDPFGEPSLLSVVSSSASEASPTVTANGATLVFESDRLGGTNGQLFVATRGSLAASFGAPTLLANVNATSDEATPYLRPDGQMLYFSSNRGGAGMDLYRAALQPNGSFAGPAPIVELNSGADEYSPCVSHDDLTVFWGSKRTDLQGYGDFDIYIAERVSASDGFASIANVGHAINSPALDLPGWVSPDGCALYMESERGGQRDIYVARRPK